MSENSLKKDETAKCRKGGGGRGGGMREFPERKGKVPQLKAIFWDILYTTQQGEGKLASPGAFCIAATGNYQIQSLCCMSMYRKYVLGLHFRLPYLIYLSSILPIYTHPLLFQIFLYAVLSFSLWPTVFQGAQSKFFA